jgi:hypothetical protein
MGYLYTYQVKIKLEDPWSKESIKSGPTNNKYNIIHALVVDASASNDYIIEWQS